MIAELGRGTKGRSPIVPSGMAGLEYEKGLTALSAGAGTGARSQRGRYVGAVLETFVWGALGGFLVEVTRSAVVVLRGVTLDRRQVSMRSIVGLMFSIMSGVGAVVVLGDADVSPAAFVLVGAGVLLFLTTVTSWSSGAMPETIQESPDDAVAAKPPRWPPEGFAEFEVNGLTFYVGAAPFDPPAGWRGWMPRFRRWNQSNQHWLRTVFSVFGVFSLVVNVVRVVLDA